jgi:hypothetical protein
MNSEILSVRERGEEKTREIGQKEFINEVLEKIKNHI